jgi:hypothetical protein
MALHAIWQPIKMTKKHPAPPPPTNIYWLGLLPKPLPSHWSLPLMSSLQVFNRTYKGVAHCVFD